MRRTRRLAAATLMPGVLALGLIVSPPMSSAAPVSANARIEATGVLPHAPTQVTAVGRNSRAVVRWMAPAPPDDTPHVAFVGDSIPNSLMPHLVRATEAIGWGAVDLAFGGCAITGAFQVDAEGKPFWWSSRCSDGFAEMQSKAMNDFSPEVVVWYSNRERQTFRVKGRDLVSGTPEFVRVRDADLERAYHRFAARGARIAIVLPVPRSPSTEGYCGLAPDDAICLTDEDYHASFASLRAAFRRLADRHPDRVSLVNVDDILCPNGRDCPVLMSDGQAVRPDGIHFSESGAAWFSPLLIDRLGLAQQAVGYRGIDDAPMYANAVTAYTVTASPGGKTCRWTNGPLMCVVTGLRNEVSYTFTVVAENTTGVGPRSEPSIPVMPRSPRKPSRSAVSLP
jgi:SGNH domain (fused to AT3 domains)